jgi:stage II sporulation protein GA (sporulation sigma-E factor processing peptidase)
VLAVQLLQGRRFSFSDGLLYAPAGLKTLLFSGAICYGLFLLVFGRLGKHGGLRRDLISAVLTADGRKTKLTALLDTGSTLTDPISNRPVLVAELDSFKCLLPPHLRPLLCRRALEQPAETFEALSLLGESSRFRLIPYRAVGTASGLLLAFRTDSAVIGGKRREGLLVALSPTPLSDGGGYTALAGL